MVTPEEAFKDTWSNTKYLDELEAINKIDARLCNFLKLMEKSVPSSHISYLTNMAIRCYYMKNLLKDTGSFYFHCDPTMSHYVKIMLDYIFGEKNFRNEIVWCYKSGGAGKTTFASKHDVILFYTKTKNYIFNVQKEKSYIQANGFKVEKFQDKNGWYTIVNCKDYWNIDMVGRSSSERLDYPTQKPEALLERIIKASTNEGDLVADFFMGGGTTIAVAEKLKRNWLGCDLNYRSIQITKNRIEKLNPDLEIKKDYVITGFPNTAKEMRQMIDENLIGESKNSKFELEDIVVKYYLQNVQGNSKKVGDGSIDGYFGYTYNNTSYRGVVQVTSSKNINHLKSFCNEVRKDNSLIGVYVTFEDNITDGMIKEVKSCGKHFGIDRVQFLTLEDLIDRNIQYKLPTVVNDILEAV